MRDDEARARCNLARDLPDAEGFRELLVGLDLTHAEWCAAAWLASRKREYADILKVVTALGTHAFLRGGMVARKVQEHIGGDA